LPPQESSNISLRGEYLSFVDTIMYPTENETEMGCGKYWFNFFSPTEQDAGGNYRFENWRFFAQQFHSISFGGKIEMTLKILIGQEIQEKKIDLLTDKGKNNNLIIKLLKLLIYIFLEDFLDMMENKARNRKKYLTCKLNDWSKILGTFESKQKNSQFKEGNKGRKPREFKIPSRTLVEFFSPFFFFFL
jgi:hypothetical protein